MRSVALAVLMEVAERDAYANIALRKALGQGDMEPRDRALVTELVNETLRNLQYIDGVVNHFSKLPVDKMKPLIRTVLRLSVCQLRILTKIPPHAAVHQGVEMAKAHGFSSLSGFVNGVLRAVARQPDKPVTDPARWAQRYSYPEGLASSLVRWLGEDGAESFARHSHTPPAIPIYTNTTKTTPTALEKSLQAQGVECTPLEGGFFIVRNTGDITALRAFEEGAFFVMDPGAMWVVHALGLEPGHVFLDLCAAPGGKAFAAACVMGDAGEIIATDIHPHRVALMEKAAKRLGLKSIKTMAQDALAPIGLPLADAVLLDVPCSGLGTLRKRPEIKHKYKGANTALLDTQRDLLSAAAKRVKPGGVLVYATCTVAREENMEMVQGFCRAHPGFAVEPLPFLPPANLPHFMQENCLQLLPGLHNDGFFIARIRQIFP